MTKIKTKTNPHTILLVVILIISLINGCQSCTNRNAINNNSKKIAKVHEDVKTINSKIFTIYEKSILHYTSIIDAIEDNAEMVLILEKEIDDQKIKSSAIKKLINENRK